MTTMTTMTTEAHTITAATLLDRLISATCAHDLACDGIHKAYTAKLAALEAIRKAGYIDVQSGRDKDKDALKGFYPYSLASGAFRAAFLKRAPAATDAQISARLKQDIISLKRMLQTGRFVSNVGRETPMREFDSAVSASASADMLAYTSKMLARATEATSKALSQDVADIKAHTVKAFESAAFIAACKDSTEDQKQAAQDKAEVLAEQSLVAEQKAEQAVKAASKAKADQAKADQAKAAAKVKVDSAKVKVESAKVKVESAKVESAKVESAKAKVDSVKSDGKPELASVDRILKNAVDNLTESEIKELIMKLQAYIA